MRVVPAELPVVLVSTRLFQSAFGDFLIVFM